MIEKFIYRILSEKECENSIVNYLSRTNNMPAIFLQAAPCDSAEKLFPRVDYTFEKMANDERKTEGLLTINVWCLSTSNLGPEDFEKRIRKMFSDVFIKVDTETYSFRWDRNDYFEYQDSTRVSRDMNSENPQILGVTLFFDVLAYPMGSLSEPDPVVALMDYIRINYSECNLVGSDDIDDIFRVSDEKPAIYCRLSKLEKAEEWHLCQWMNAGVAVHIFAASAEKRKEMVKSLADAISKDDYVKMRGNSLYMRCLKTNVNMEADIAKMGQIQFTFHYGIVRNQRVNGIKLNNVNFNNK